MKITIIGAGSIVFTRNLINDILLVPELQACQIALMDIDITRLEQARRTVQAIIDQRNLAANVTATTERRAALDSADYVITTFQQGGLEAYQLDIEIPQKYGVGQCVGDTLGPGGVFRALRTIPVLTAIAAELDAVAPDALLLNYVNPMAANCWAFERMTGRPAVGLCHSVQDTSRMLARWLNVPYDELVFQCVGINHQAFFTTLRHGSADLYPALRQLIKQPEKIGLEPVRIEMMRHFGYFVTESSGHASEYAPYFRKSAAMIDSQLAPQFTDKGQSGWFDYGRTGGYLRNCEYWAAHAADAFDDGVIENERSHEYGSYIIEAIACHRPIVINGNVPNAGLIANLPHGCCVEVPCFVDGNGIRPMRIANYPTQLAALNRTNVNVQELIVEAAVHNDVEAVHHAVMLDPLTAAVCMLPQIREMVTEMLAAQARWLPF